MIAVYLVAKEDVADQLELIGCEKVVNVDDELALWRTPWDFYFTVPELGPDGRCAKHVLLEILADVERSRPITQ